MTTRFHNAKYHAVIRSAATPLWVLVILSVVGWGCRPASPPRGQVSGVVTLGGEPITVGSVVFENLELGVSQVASLDGNGRFTLVDEFGPGIRVGSYRVAVVPSTMSRGETPMVADPTLHANRPEGDRIPQRYQHPASSPFTCVVTEGENPDALFELVE